MLLIDPSEENRFRVTRTANGDRAKGKFTWPDGRRYEGEFLNGHLQGLGAMTWPDGSSYKGEWKNDLPHGRGVFHLE